MYNDIQGETTTFKELGFRIYNLPTLQKESLASVTLYPSGEMHVVSTLLLRQKLRRQYVDCKW